MRAPSYAPVYCAMYPELARIARAHGYALAIHGTMARDCDLICVPWTPEPAAPDVVVTEITRVFDIRVVGDPAMKLHGRVAWTIAVGFGECAIDLSFIPCCAGDDGRRGRCDGRTTMPKRRGCDEA